MGFAEFVLKRFETFSVNTVQLTRNPPPPGGVLPENLGRGARPASQNPYPIHDQNLRFSLLYL